MKEAENFKMKVRNPKESEEAQKILLKLGYSWCPQKEILYIDEPYLFFDFEDKCITYTKKESKDFFNNQKNRKITLTELKSKSFQNRLKKLLILRRLKK